MIRKVNGRCKNSFGFTTVHMGVPAELVAEQRPEWLDTVFYEGLNPVLLFVILGAGLLGALVLLWTYVVRGKQDATAVTEGSLYSAQLDPTPEQTGERREQVLLKSSTRKKVSGTALDEESARTRTPDGAQDPQQDQLWQLGYSPHFFGRIIFGAFVMYATVVHALLWLVVLSFYKSQMMLWLLNWGLQLNVCTPASYGKMPWCDAEKQNVGVWGVCDFFLKLYPQSEKIVVSFVIWEKGRGRG